MTREQFISSNRIEDVLVSRGVSVVGGGVERSAKCPFHEDRTASMAVNVAKGTWFCHAGCGGGSVIDLLAKFTGATPVDYMKQNQIGLDDKQQLRPSAKPEIERLYSYTDALGGEVFQVVRMKPKTFRQRHKDTSGNWVWNMEGVERVLYRLPDIVKAQSVWIVEGEKDADTLSTLGFTATCNVGGAGKWMDGYTESLEGKDVVICGDNDKAGREHVEKVFDSLAGKVKTARMVTVPSPHKDVSDYAAAIPEPRKALEELRDSATPFVRGIKLPLYTMAELEPRYRKQVQESATTMLDLSRWLPSFSNKVRPLVPGELVLILGDTGTGKSALLQSIALHAKPLPTIFFELELPAELMFERFVAMRTRQTCSFIEKAYRTEEGALGSHFLDNGFPNLLICSESRMSLSQLEAYINRSELKLGTKPKLVCLDYVQLIEGSGKRYERTSDAAEGLKVVAKSTGTIIVMASQVHRSSDEDPELSLHSGKDSGALENSSGLVLGAWRDPSDKTLLHLKVLKNTKGTGGLHVECNFDGERMTITERSRARDYE